MLPAENYMASLLRRTLQLQNTNEPINLIANNPHKVSATADKLNSVKPVT
jgi:hypothetical protein